MKILHNRKQKNKTLLLHFYQPWMSDSYNSNPNDFLRAKSTKRENREKSMLGNVKGRIRKMAKDLENVSNEVIDRVSALITEQLKQETSENDYKIEYNAWATLNRQKIVDLLKNEIQRKELLEKNYK